MFYIDQSIQKYLSSDWKATDMMVVPGWAGCSVHRIYGNITKQCKKEQPKQSQKSTTLTTCTTCYCTAFFDETIRDSAPSGKASPCKRTFANSLSNLSLYHKRFFYPSISWRLALLSKQYGDLLSFSWSETACVWAYTPDDNGLSKKLLKTTEVNITSK